MMAMTRRSLPDLLSNIVDNRGRSCPTATSGFPLIATNCLRGGLRHPTFENIRYVSDEVYSNWFRAHPQPDDVLFVCKGSPGRVAIVPDPVTFCIAQDMVSLRADLNVIDPTYLYYRLRSPDVQHAISNLHVGTMIPHFKKGDFGKLHFDVHDNLDVQRAISEVLGALDDKIAANVKLASTAITLADSIFFRESRGVNPGTATFADLALVQGGGTPSTKVEEYWGGHSNWATPTDVTALKSPYLESTSRLITDAGLAACSSALHPAGSILMTSRATIGAFAIAQAPTAVNQGFIVVNAHDAEAQWWLFHEMRSRVPEFLSHANGATFLELSRGKFKQFRVRLPVKPAVKHFSDEVGPLHARARAATVESTRLAEMRDVLLPLLMSGKIRVKDAEGVVEGVV